MLRRVRLSSFERCLPRLLAQTIGGQHGTTPTPTRVLLNVISNRMEEMDDESLTTTMVT